MAKTGQMDRQTYEPGQKRPEAEPVPEGRYRLKLQPAGRKGREWRKKDPKAFPYKRLLFKAYDRDGNVVQDEATGQDATLSFILSSNPRAFFMVYDFAYAAAYPEKFSLPEVTKSDDPKVEERCGVLDAIIDFVDENDVALNAFVTVGEHNGRPNNDVRWEAPDEDDEASGDEEAEETEVAEESEAEESDETEDEATEDEDEDEDETEEVEEEIDHSPKPVAKKVAPVKKPAPKPVKKGKR